ncbi:hypothetical protein [Spirillospora albida]|uniref:hypothetical protein n=1 Tax=Spirillospora albida TaxID=58123 RepID=UPI0004C1B68D|nr:hypothetical protein [Spirillospora albida]
MGSSDSGESSGPKDDGARQHVSHTRVGRDLYQLSGNVGVLTLSRFLIGMAVVLVVTIVIVGAFYVRGQIRDPEREASDGAAGQRPVAGAAPSGSAPTTPSATEPLIKAVTDTNPLNLRSRELLEMYGRQEDWIIPSPRVVRGAPKVNGERLSDGLYRFVKERGGVAVNRLFFSVTVQNLTGGAAALRSMRVTDLACGPPLKGTRLWSGGGADPLTPRVILLDLDSAEPKPLLFPRLPEDRSGDDGASKIDPRAAQPFGFTLAEGETESFDVMTLSFKHRSCRFRLAITATLNGRNEQIVVDDGGAPFAVAGNPALDYWTYFPREPWESRWLRDVPPAEEPWKRSPSEPLEQTTP